MVIDDEGRNEHGHPALCPGCKMPTRPSGARLGGHDLWTADHDPRCWVQNLGTPVRDEWDYLHGNPGRFGHDDINVA